MPQCFNVYAYCRNRPLTYSDPTGCEEKSTDKATGNRVDAARETSAKILKTAEQAGKLLNEIEETGMGSLPSTTAAAKPVVQTAVVIISISAALARSSVEAKRGAEGALVNGVQSYLPSLLGKLAGLFTKSTVPGLIVSTLGASGGKEYFRQFGPDADIPKQMDAKFKKENSGPDQAGQSYLEGRGKY